MRRLTTLVVFSLLWSTQAFPSGRLVGHVFAADGKPAQASRVLLIGKDKKVIEAGGAATFEVTAAAGYYEALVFCDTDPPTWFSQINLREGATARVEVHSQDRTGVVFFDEPGHGDLDQENAQLAAMDEPPLCASDLNDGGDSFRFVWLRSFDPAVVLRMHVDPTGHVTAVYKEAGEESGRPTGRVNRRDIDVNAIQAERVSTDDLRNEFLTICSGMAEKIDAAPFAVDDGSLTLDGAGWTVEHVRAGKCHVATRHSPNRSEPVRGVAEEMLALADIAIDYRSFY